MDTLSSHDSPTFVPRAEITGTRRGNFSTGVTRFSFATCTRAANKETWMNTYPGGYVLFSRILD